MPFTTAQSLLFVPGDRAERIPKALASAAGAVIVDLEDAVAPEAKDRARRAVGGFLAATPSARILLRINAVDSPWYDGDRALAAYRGVVGVVLPKSDLASLTRAAGDTDTPLWPLVETAQGIQDMPGLARIPGVARLLLGTIDLALDLGLDAAHPGGRTMLDMARYQLVNGSVAAGLALPVDGVFTDLGDDTGLAACAAHAKACGMTGMMCIHPKQTEVVNAAFSPDPAQTDWARRVLDAAVGQNGAFRFEGQMIDKPVLGRAARILTS
ncbi:(3S)-malyl-CoA thioesterase [Thalassovita gelatinovora]|uniref:(3S)-malyl-CoA thioesterase n=1 Tax=Thalassovita gelatinovora TaxID=53501 RepID=A0A0P1F3W2_THAGE|nr:CoA ester lyase [Thalassovita gelatinovora]QIZ82613.1 CoA ester lyase [Thalassovita gelatinovora]CUH62313.1 (3S)-malyl-CoA thioesterase [Thalassovita gelatinovora]SER15395.1 (S)-citramalyl-CoA lyase [Thalassovita gelatinovora]